MFIVSCFFFDTLENGIILYSNLYLKGNTIWFQKYTIVKEVPEHKIVLADVDLISTLYVVQTNLCV